jgi:hypothetical protein
MIPDRRNISPSRRNLRIPGRDLRRLCREESYNRRDFRLNGRKEEASRAVLSLPLVVKPFRREP